MEFSAVFKPFVIALISACGLAWAISRWAPLFGVVDKPAEHKIHRNPTPILGGIAIWGGFCLSVVIGLFILGLGKGSEGRIGLLILAAATTLHLLGLCDDIRVTTAGVKFIGQLAIVITFVSIFTVKSSVLPRSFLSAALAGFWILAIINAMNLIDGLDGLAGGITVIACMVFLLMGWHKPKPLVTLLAVSLAGAAMGFLLFNFHPARLFMGDSGSLLLGFLLATIALLIVDRPSTPSLSLLIPLFVLGIPLIDITLTFCRRLFRRNSPFLGDLGHTYNKVMDTGHSHRVTVLIFYCLSILFGMTGLALYYRKLVSALALGVLSFGLVAYGTLKYRFLD